METLIHRTRGKKLQLLCFIIATVLFASGCAQLPPPPDSGVHATSAGQKKTIRATGSSTSSTKRDSIQQLLVEGANTLVGQKTIVVRGKQYNADCVGAILAIYAYADIDLIHLFDQYTGNGVTRLYKALDAFGLLHDSTRPSPGDLIFWDNTYDRNSDGKWNDYLTHIGMVTKVDEVGNIEFVHYHYTKGVALAFMNLRHPNDQEKPLSGGNKVLNSAMRMKGSGTPDASRWLASQLLRSFGEAYKIKA